MKEPQFLTDAKGERIAVVISIEEYEKLIEDAEDREDLQAVREYEAAKAAGEVPVPFEQVMDEIRRNRK
jgi:hypothetical protein